MRKILYFTILATCIVSIYILKDYACIRCIEKDEGFHFTSITEINEFMYKLTDCPECRENN